MYTDVPKDVPSKSHTPRETPATAKPFESDTTKHELIEIHTQQEISKSNETITKTPYETKIEISTGLDTTLETPDEIPYETPAYDELEYQI